MLPIANKSCHILRKFSLDASIPQQRQVLDQYPSPDAPTAYSNRFSMDCHSCMLVEMGEKANYMGLPCENCGKVPRTPYGYW